MLKTLNKFGFNTGKSIEGKTNIASFPVKKGNLLYLFGGAPSFSSSVFTKSKENCDSNKHYRTNYNKKYFCDNIIDGVLKKKFGKGGDEPYRTNPNQKRSKVMFIRDGMVISFVTRKTPTVNPSTPGVQKDSYVFVEIREYLEEINSQQERDPRFLLIKPQQLSKFLLLKPKSYVDPRGLDTITFQQKYRNLTVNQMKDNKYLFTLEVFPKVEEGDTSDKIISQIELNPEDVALLLKFIDIAIEELLNL
mmetsp:Transcript_6796/g.7050  ORF Transcript_6796/g.7050 Transcript_6796/m.7050 type:complete len:249 (-) Transcript_6796:94-840(-)